MDLRMAEAAIAGADFEGLAERAPQLLGVAARQAAGESRWREVADLYDEYAEHLPPALLEAAEVELGLNRPVAEDTTPGFSRPAWPPRGRGRWPRPRPARGRYG